MQPGAEEAEQKLHAAAQAFDAGQYSEALGVLATFPTDLSDEILVRKAYYEGLCRLRQDEWKLAVAPLSFVSSKETQPYRLYQVRLLLAYAHTQLENYQKAIGELCLLLEGGMESPQIFSSLAYNQWKKGDEEKANECYEKAVSLSEQPDATLFNSYAFFLSDTGRSLSRANTYAKKALALSPQNPVFLDTAAWIAFKAEHLKSARDLIQQASAQDPKSPTIALHKKLIEKRK